MKRWELVAGILVLLLASLIVPWQMWLHDKRVRFQHLTAQLPECRTIPCVTQLQAELQVLKEEIENRPWYVWGEVDLK